MAPATPGPGAGRRWLPLARLRAGRRWRRLGGPGRGAGAFDRKLASRLGAREEDSFGRREEGAAVAAAALLRGATSHARRPRCRRPPLSHTETQLAAPQHRPCLVPKRPEVGAGEDRPGRDAPGPPAAERPPGWVR